MLARRVGFMPQREVEIVNESGLNAAAAAKLTQLAAKYQCEVAMLRNGRRVNAKSLMGVMMLAAGKGSRIVLATEGPDETEALDAIVALVSDAFGERRSGTDAAGAA
jgi:phosphocarrier protein HPr